MKYLVQRDNCQSVLNLKIITRTSIDRKMVMKIPVIALYFKINNDTIL